MRLPVRIFNAVGHLRRRLGHRPPGFVESEERWLEAASRAAGLADFGQPAFRDGLSTLLRAYDEEARLSPFGRWLVEQQLVGILESRLAIEDAWKRSPGILERPIRRPLFILGLPRTGTTALHQILARDPANQVLEYWLGASPMPRPPRAQWARHPRYREAARGLRLTYYLDPGLRAIHDLRADGPDECRHLLLLSFSDDTFDSNATIPGYTAWLRQQDMRIPYAYHRDALKLVGSTSPEKRWVLKYPAHMGRLDVVFETYPEACIVQTHRDPARVLPSLCSLVTRWRGLYEEGVDVEAVARWQVEMWAERMERAMAARERYEPKQFLDLTHREIVDDPLAAVRRIYAHFDLPWSEAGEREMRRWREENPPGRHGEHRYSAARFGLEREAIAERFSAYLARFDVGA